MAKFKLLNVATGEEFEVGDVVFGTIQKVEYGEKSTKIVVKDVAGNVADVLDLSSLTGQAVILNFVPVELIPISDKQQAQGLADQLALEI